MAWAATPTRAASAFSALRQPMSTRAPAAARASADRRPRPLLAPVMRIVRPVWSGMSLEVQLDMAASSHDPRCRERWPQGRSRWHSGPVPDRHDLHLRHTRIHGHEVGYRMAGSGPAVVFVHGLAGSSTTWQEVLPALADRYTVLAPDLLGHGESAKPRGDYSLGAYASGLRDLMVAVGIERATFVGHSLGGGVALQLAYQFPERCDRLVLVASGGLGKEVSPLLRAVSLPGSELVMPVLLSGQMHSVLDAVNRWFGRRGLRLGPTGREVWRSYAGLSETRGRLAFIHTVRSVIDPLGQRVSAR